MYDVRMPPLILEVRHLQLVAAIVDEGSLTRAGDRLHLTQSALSHQLLEVEQRLGTPLFHRVNKRMLLTDAGQRVLSSARRILAELAETEEDLQLHATHRKGSIRLTTECYTVYHWLPAVMKRFEEQFPGIDIHIDVDATDSPMEALTDGTIDVAFVTSDSSDRRIEVETLFADELKVIVPPGHPLAAKSYVTAKELARETLLTYSALKGNVMYERVLRPAGLEPKKHLQVRLTEAILELVKGGVGVAVLAQWAVAPYVNAGAVVAVPLTRRGLERHWKAASLATRPMPPFVRAFIDMVATEGPRALATALHLAAAR
jgi:LysR family transcriptional regulator, regulator for metE and metH